jgi:hypothetical protein
LNQIVFRKQHFSLSAENLNMIGGPRSRPSSFPLFPFAGLNPFPPLVGLPVGRPASRLHLLVETKIPLCGDPREVVVASDVFPLDPGTDLLIRHSGGQRPIGTWTRRGRRRSRDNSPLLPPRSRITGILPLATSIPTRGSGGHWKI